MNKYGGAVLLYFGGIKLGAGGLIRAYGNAVSETVKTIGINEKKKMQIIEINFNYNLISILDSKLANYKIVNKEFLETVTYQLQIDLNEIDIFINYIIDLTNNNISYLLKDTIFTEVPIT